MQRSALGAQNTQPPRPEPLARARDRAPAGRLVLVVALAVAVRLAVLLAYLATHHGQPEVWEYEVIAQHLLDGKGYVYVDQGAVRRSFGWPLFPFVSYLLHLAGGRDTFIPFFAFHLAVSAGLVWLTYRIARRWLDEPTALVAALLAAVEPGLVVYGSYKVHETILAAFLLLAATGLFDVLRRRPDGRTAAAMGLVTGLGILTRGTVIAVFAPLAVWIARSTPRARRVLRGGLVVLAVAALTLLPWTIRNYLVLGRFVLVSSGWTSAIWRGNAPATTGSNLTLEGKPILEASDPAFQARVLEADEMGRYQIYERGALAYVRAHPLAFLGRTAAKFGYFFWFTPTYGQAPPYRFVRTSFLLGYQILYGGLLLVALAGAWAACRDPSPARRETAWLLLLLMVSVAAIHAVAYVEGRHKLIVMPILLMFTAHGATTTARRVGLAGRGQRPSAADTGRR